MTEIDAVEALESFRRDTGLLKDVSFPTIAGAGSDGAIVHYRVTRRSNRRIVPGELFLINSGGQYEDGTTDITRTVAVGTPTDEYRERFTLVLKGHIAIARALFPDGTTGAQLDTLRAAIPLARRVDFDHGTGHGVGSYLSVHEGPARISKLGTAPLKRGMILSNEPGYYRTGAYGIRIENLILVTEAAAGRRRGKAVQRLRDVDAGADRPAPGRACDAERRGDRAGSMPITRACAIYSADLVDPLTQDWLRGDGADRTELISTTFDVKHARAYLRRRFEYVFRHIRLHSSKSAIGNREELLSNSDVFYQVG